MIYPENRSTSVGLVLGALACLSVPAYAQEHEDFDSYPSGGSVVGLGGWEEWGAGAGASTSSAQALSLPNSIDIVGGSDLVHQYSGYTSGQWEYTAKMFIPTGSTGKSYFILLSQYTSPSGPYQWAVEVAFNNGTMMVEGDAGGAAAGAKLPLLVNQWVDIKVVIDLDADWVKFYYGGAELDDLLVPDHATLGGGWTWTKGPFGNSAGLKNIGAVDLYANNASSVYYDEIKLTRTPTWCDDIDSYAAGVPIVNLGGWEEWGAGAGANTSSAQSRGPGNSIDISGPSDLVHQYSGQTSGKWEYSAYQYIPTGTTGTNYFILLSKYAFPSGPYSWAVQVRFDNLNGNVIVDAGGANDPTTPIVNDQWVHLQVMIDLDADWVQFYYNGTLMDDAILANHPTLGGGWTWTKGYNGTSTGSLAIAAVDLFANNSTPVYYDDISLRPVFKGVRSWGDPSTGSNGDPRIFALGDANVPNANFGLGCRSAAPSAVGILVLGTNNVPTGLQFAGISLYVDPSFIATAPANAGPAGGSTVSLPLIAAYQGVTLFAQYVWVDPVLAALTASDGMQVDIR